MIERSAAIQAGGASSRMGRDKGLVLLDGVPLIERVLETVQPLVEDVLITTNAPDDYRYLALPLAQDDHPAAGALEGLRTALRHASGELVLVVGCDMPFLERNLLSHLLAPGGDWDVVVPRWDDRLQPLCAVYRRRTCLAAVEDSLHRGDRRLISFHGAVRVRVLEPAEVRRLDPAGMSFFNVNTPEDLESAEAILARSMREGTSD
jgi:molybdopterin-guanine dinucleotide biosynthesis protein A